MSPAHSWRYVALFNNLSIEEAVGNDFVAIAPPSDPRISVERADGGLRTFVARFSDQFGRKITPSVLILREDVKPDVELFVGFRNALAVTALAEGWMRFLSRGVQIGYFRFSDSFSLYPHTLAKDGQNVIVQAPALLGLDELKTFRGQTSPAIPHAHASGGFCDTYLLNGLLARWSERYIQGDKNWSNVALFRSLQMAFRASAMPFQNHATLEDYGAQLALWVSAHEVLTRPENEKVDLSKVLATLANARLANSGLRAKRYVSGVPKCSDRVSLLQKLYCEMYRARNDFIHGNPVEANAVFPGGRKERYPLLYFAPIVYRFALYDFLGLWNDTVSTPEKMSHERVRRGAYEHAVLAARNGRGTQRRRS
ncbi:hypothetical protein ACW73L_08655 [Methylolobus aquaticus]